MAFSTWEHAYCISMECPKLWQAQWPLGADVEMLAVTFSNQKYLFSQEMSDFRLELRTAGSGTIFPHLDHDNCINFVLVNLIN